MAPTDADVVEHGGFLKELRVELQFRVLTGSEQATVGHLARVFQQEAAQGVVLGVVLVYNLLIIHDAVWVWGQLTRNTFSVARVRAV